MDIRNIFAEKKEIPREKAIEIIAAIKRITKENIAEVEGKVINLPENSTKAKEKEMLNIVIPLELKKAFTYFTLQRFKLEKECGRLKDCKEEIERLMSKGTLDEEKVEILKNDALLYNGKKKIWNYVHDSFWDFFEKELCLPKKESGIRAGWKVVMLKQ